MGKAWEGTNWGCWVWAGEIKNSLLDIYGMHNRHLGKNCSVCELSSYVLWKLLGNLLILEEWLNIVVLHSGCVWFIYCTSFFNWYSLCSVMCSCEVYNSVSFDKCGNPCNYGISKNTEYFHYTRSPCAPFQPILHPRGSHFWFFSL